MRHRSLVAMYGAKFVHPLSQRQNDDDLAVRMMVKS